MLAFQELRITPDGKYLIIDVAVEENDYYKDVTIDSIVIDNQDTFTNAMPSNNPIFVHTVENNKYLKVYALPGKCNCNQVLDEDYAYCFVDELNKAKSLRLKISAEELGGIGNNLFFVYAVAGGMPSPSTPCGMDTYIKLGTVANFLPIYQNLMSLINEVEGCDIPNNLINQYLRFKAVELGIKSGNYLKAIEYWRRFFIDLKPLSKTGCRCRS